MNAYQNKSLIQIIEKQANNFMVKNAFIWKANYDDEKDILYSLNIVGFQDSTISYVFLAFVLFHLTEVELKSNSEDAWRTVIVYTVTLPSKDLLPLAVSF